MSITQEIKKTPLWQDHVNLGARMVEFAGWSMPIQYKGVTEEHLNVRNHVGLFDVSHMGEIRFRGPKSLESLEWLTTNHVAKLKANEAQYSLVPNDQGGLVDDVIVYCIKPQEDYLVCVNASNKDKDFSWFQKHNKGADITDESNYWAQIAIQGPKALELTDKVFNLSVSSFKPFQFVTSKWQNYQIIIATTGYTGEKGCEVFIESKGASELWKKLLNDGASFNAQAIGLGARDTLRTEMKYSLYGHEIDDITNPYAATLGWVIKPNEKDFFNKQGLVAEKNNGLKFHLVGFKMKDKGIPRQGYKLFTLDGLEMGQVTSGTHSPTLNEPIGIGYVLSSLKDPGAEFYVDIRGRKVKAAICKTPFVSTSL